MQPNLINTTTISIQQVRNHEIDQSVKNKQINVEDSIYAMTLAWQIEKGRCAVCLFM
jgi:hypothetical protein